MRWHGSRQRGIEGVYRAASTKVRAVVPVALDDGILKSESCLHACTGVSENPEHVCVTTYLISMKNRFNTGRKEGHTCGNCFLSICQM